MSDIPRRKRHYFNIMQFHLPDATSFLSMTTLIVMVTV